MIDLKDLLDSPDEYFTSQVISDNIKKDDNGFLILTNIVAARTGVQKYYGKELGITDPQLKDEMFYLERPPEVVFDSETIKSFNSAAFTDGHPIEERRVTATNGGKLIKGNLRNARKAKFKDENGNELLLVDAVITDEKVIQDILNGKRQVSAGYAWDYKVISLEEHKLKVTKIRANHLALVDRGRAGTAVILDEDIDIVIPLNHKENITKILIDEGGEDVADEKVHKFSVGENEDYHEYHVKGDFTKEEAQQIVLDLIDQENND
jgi:hypothetical protein